MAARLGHELFDAMYVSNLRRTAETAAPLIDRTGMTPVVQPDLREVFLGEWEGGLLRQKAADHDPVLERVFAEQRWDLIPGAEPRAEFGGRLHRAVERITAAHPGGGWPCSATGPPSANCSLKPPAPGLRVGADNASISSSW